MKVKLQYAIIVIIIIVLSIIIPNIMTSSKYFSNIEMESDVPIALMIFELNNIDKVQSYNISKGESVIAKYQLTNKDDSGRVNQLDLRYSIKVVDENDNENLKLDITLEDNNYIELAFDGTEDAKTVNINIKCPEDYSGDSLLKYKVKVLAECISNENITAEKYIDLIININDANEVTDADEVNFNGTLEGQDKGKDSENYVNEVGTESESNQIVNNGVLSESGENVVGSQNEIIDNNEVVDNGDENNQGEPVIGTDGEFNYDFPMESSQKH